MAQSAFRFKKFEVYQAGAVHPVGMDGVLLGAWTEIRESDQMILDIGAGTGLIALMLAQRSAQAVIHAVEKDIATAACARENFSRSPWAIRLQLHLQDIQTWVTTHADNFDLIVSNPPFFTENTLSPDARRASGRSVEALPFQELIAAVNNMIAYHGRFCVILPANAAGLFIEKSTLSGLYCTKEVLVYSKKPDIPERVLLQFEKNAKHYQKSTLHLYEPDGSYSLAYRQLTEGFYL